MVANRRVRCTGIRRRPTLRDQAEWRIFSGHQIDIKEDCVMTKAVSIALLVGGIVLLYFGGQSFHSFSNDVSRVFTGAPTNKTIYLLAGGAIATIAGLIGLTLGGRR
jgi:hypothetical protein